MLDEKSLEREESFCVSASPVDLLPPQRSTPARAYEIPGVKAHLTCQGEVCFLLVLSSSGKLPRGHHI